MRVIRSHRAAQAIAFLLAISTMTAGGQQRGPRNPGDTLHSPVIGERGVVTFQLYAPKASEVTLRTEGPAPFADQKLTRSDAGVWSLTASVPADLYIYWFDV